MERRGTAEDLEVCSVTERQLTKAESEGRGSQGGAEWSASRGGMTGLEVRGRARGSTHQGGAGEQEAQGGSKLLGEASVGGAE